MMGGASGYDGDSTQQDLAAAIHETTNALTVILGWIERARQVCDGQPQAVTALSRAARYAHTARHAMRRAIGAELASAPAERASDLVGRITEDLAVESKRCGVSIVQQVAERSRSEWVAEPEMVWQVLTNLLLNAIAHSPKGGTVTLGLSHDHHEVVFEVSDEGPGVPDYLVAELFVGRTSLRPGGTGIGLRHAQALASSLDGELALLDSETGARFVLRCPRGDAPQSDAPQSDAPRSDAPRSDAPRSDAQVQPQAKPGSSDHLGGAQVLLLEDDAAVIELLELTLEARGAAVTTVGNAAALGEALDTGGYDVMLVDLSPLSTKGVSQAEQSGLDGVIARAKGANPDIGVVVISGSVTVQPRPDVVWVRKPFDPGELVEAIAKHRRS